MGHPPSRRKTCREGTAAPAQKLIRSLRIVEQNSTGENVDRYRDAFIDAEIAYSELFEAARVIRKKHPEAPECFRQCSLIDQRLH